ncbi:MAG: hypothetical protein IPJ76_02510 [Flavobacteriales bacterium]|nr:MAG: hypothetical protein IPJ76_02510 [Flavobacteriales bacterium]
MRLAPLFLPLFVLACSAPVDDTPAVPEQGRDTTVFSPGPDTASTSTILVYGRIKDAETGEGMERFHIRVADGVSGALVDSATVVDDSASYELEIDYGRSYRLYYTADGYTTKSMVVDARGIPAMDDDGGFGMHMDVGLVERLPDVDYSMLDEPLGQARYMPEDSAMQWDSAHVAQRRALLKTLMEEQARVRSRLPKR